MQSINTKTFKPSEAICRNSSIGKALYQKIQNKRTHYSSIFKSADLLKDADLLTSGEELSLQDIKGLYFKLQTLEKSFKSKEKAPDGHPTEASLQYMMCGASAGLAWCKKILKAEGILKLYTKDITDEEINSAENAWFTQVSITKAVDEELMQGTYIVLEPDVIDLHGDTYSEEEVRKACHNFNSNAVKCNLFHMVETNGFSIAESYVTPVDMILGDQFVKKGTWLAVLQYNDTELWDLAKSGEICGVSIGALATVENLE